MPSTLRYTNELMQRLEQVADRGCAEMTDHELRRWYGLQRIGSTVWFDIEERWAEVCGHQPDRPQLLTRGTGYGYLFIRADGWMSVMNRAKSSKQTPSYTNPEGNADTGSD